jgi:hypothetical protein
MPTQQLRLTALEPTASRPTTWATYRRPSVPLDTLARDAIAHYYTHHQRLPQGILCCPKEVDAIRQALHRLDLHTLAQRLDVLGGVLRGELWLA